MAATNVTKKASKKSAPVKAVQPKKSAPLPQAQQTRPVVAGRSPVQTLAQICAQNANRTRGEVQQQWFALGSYVALFGSNQQMAQSGSLQQPQIGEQQQTPRTMAAGAGAGD